MDKPFFVTEEQAIDLVSYLYGFGSCPYCHYRWGSMPDAIEYSTHLVKCVNRLEAELKKTA